MSARTTRPWSVILTVTACLAALVAMAGCQTPERTAAAPQAADARQDAVAKKVAGVPSAPEEEKLRQDMRNWSLDRVITGSPSLETYTEAELVTYAELQARGHVSRLKREYQLTPEQEKAVRKRLDELQAAYPSYWKKNQTEYSKLNGQIKQMSANRQDPAVAAQVRELSSRRSRLTTANPLYSAVVNAEIEELLPENQVAAAQERREKATATRLAQFKAVTAGGTSGLSASTRRTAPLVLLRGRSSSPFSSWRYYVNLFIETYDLDDKQQAQAEAILEESEGRRDDYQESHEKDFVALRNTKGLEARFAKGEELRTPIAKMFEELKERLDKIPTADQRKAAEDEVETAKAAAATRPSASRPAARILRPAAS